MSIFFYNCRVGSSMISEIEMDDPDTFFIPDTAVHNVSDLHYSLTSSKGNHSR